MTDVMDEGLTWEQRRELRRKKRQELLAEADKCVMLIGSVVTCSHYDILQLFHVIYKIWNKAKIYQKF